MRHLNKIATVFCGLALGVLALTGCEGADLYSIDSPDWISEKADSIAQANQGETVLYTVGNTDFSSAWWTSFSKYYVIPDGQTWTTTFNLHINPSDNTYYKNFALVIANNNDRGTSGYQEYGAIRYDYTNDSTNYNSQWTTTGNTVNPLYFSFSSSTQVMNPVNNADALLQKLGGKVTLTVDRSDPNAFTVTMSNDGGVTKTYKQPYALGNLNSSSSDTSIRCFLVPEGSYLEFLSTNIVALGDVDAEPISMSLSGVPAEVDQGTSLEDAMANVTASITFDGNLSKTIDASQLSFTSIPDIESVGEKTLVAVYSKTYLGEAAAKPIVATATFNVVPPIASIAVTQQPAMRRYTIYNASDYPNGYPFNYNGMEVTATYENGTTSVMDNSKLTYSLVPAKDGLQTVKITTNNGKETSVNVRVTTKSAPYVTPSPTTLGADDNSTGWWGAHLDQDIKVPSGETRAFSFTNYTSGSNNWNNFVVVLRNAALGEYAVVRADNYGWGNGYAAATVNTTAGDWATWLAAMQGAKVKVYVTNNGDGTADVVAIMTGNNGKLYSQYYTGINTVDPDDFYVDFTVDGCHLVFDNVGSAKKHNAHRR